MQGLKCAAIASALMLSAGSMAWAQSYSTTPATQGTSSQGAQSAWGQSSPGGSITADTQQKIRQSLQQSGFRNIQVLPEAFVIRAQAPDGSHIAMLLSPDQVTEVITGSSVPGTQGGGATATSEQQAQQELTRYGYTELRDLKPMQGWVADATRNGENVHVMLSDNGLVATFQGR